MTDFNLKIFSFSLYSTRLHKIHNVGYLVFLKLVLKKAVASKWLM